MSRAVILAVGYPRVLDHRRRIEHPQPEARQEQPAHRGVDVGFLQQSGADRRQQARIFRATVQVRAGF